MDGWSVLALLIICGTVVTLAGFVYYGITNENIIRVLKDAVRRGSDGNTGT